MQNTYSKTIKTLSNMATIALIFGSAIVGITIWEMGKSIAKDNKNKEPERVYEGEDIYNH